MRCRITVSQTCRCVYSAMCGLLLPLTSFAQMDAFDYTARLGQGVNLGNTLEAPNFEGEWGFRLQPWHFETIADGGFDSVRVPIRWSAYAAESAPYTVRSSFFERIDWVLDQAHRNDLAVIIDMHHYDEIFDAPAAHRDRFLGIWEQIAERYQDQPDTVYFEPLNEPHNELDDETWNALVVDTLDVIRETNPDRMVILGGTGWNNLYELSDLELPEEDRNIIGTFHYYSPFQFTHQGASWVSGSDPWLGTTWEGSNSQKDQVRIDFSRASRWSRITERPVLMGEFGAYERADEDSRGMWTEFIAQEAERQNFAWSYWEFGAGFGVYDRGQQQWNSNIYDALSPRSIFDLDKDGEVRMSDYEMIVQNFGADDSAIDLDNNGVVGQSDLAFFTHFAGKRVGDFDKDGMLDADDIDLLTANLSIPKEAEYAYDTDDDGMFDDADRLFLINDLMQTRVGDLDVDGDVDSADITVLATNWTGASQAGEGSTYGTGDVDFDGDVDAADRLLIVQNWTGAQMTEGRASSSLTLTNVIPEPAGAILAIMAAAAFFRRRS